ncbi:MAG: transposase [Acidimicrobiales bacterium]
MTAVGDIGRFESPSQLLSYLGLDPKVHQSGTAPAHHGPSPSRGTREHAGPWSSRPGWSLGLPDRCAPSPSGSGLGAAPPWWRGIGTEGDTRGFSIGWRCRRSTSTTDYSAPTRLRRWRRAGSDRRHGWMVARPGGAGL